ncbi:MAG: hypothetical protein AAFN59_09085 [Pseudomonadota bacterium]
MKRLNAAAGILMLSAGFACADDTSTSTMTLSESIVSTSSFDGSTPLIPKGYRLAWTDDRLNPLRGIGTPQGDAQMRLIWTDDVPAKLVSE